MVTRPRPGQPTTCGLHNGDLTWQSATAGLTLQLVDPSSDIAYHVRGTITPPIAEELATPRACAGAANARIPTSLMATGRVLRLDAKRDLI
jgi:hypothetical protein